MRLKKIVLVLLAFVSFIEINAQEVTINNVNNFENPKHKDNIGNWAVGDTLFVKGIYTKETANINKR
ncbi:hypothetical protein [Lutibacter citreus]|uniref:hypothetical protein n=1 Tax=Lutibacter citreus TaxID=2138210 RepID=UPI000DBE71B6|nr:hypothetical protein [Lutibacter citreus]